MEKQLDTHGLLQLPDSCLHHIIGSLPGSALLAAFQTCKQLARQVAMSAPALQLRLQKQHQNYSQPQWQMLAKLLEVSQGLNVDTVSYIEQPIALPEAIQQRITALSLWQPESSPVTNAVCWAGAYNLKHLELRGDCQHALCGVCEAVQASQLPLLHSLTLPFHSSISTAALSRAANVLGAALTHLDISPHHLKCMIGSEGGEHVRCNGTSGLRSLQSITLRQGYAESTVVIWLLQHAQLQSVHFEECGVQGDHCDTACNWRSLSFRYSDDALTRLPLKTVQEIKFATYLPGYGSFDPHGHLIHDVLQTVMEKIVCEPADTGHGRVEFTVYMQNWRAGMLPVLRQLRGHDCRLIMIDCYLCKVPLHHAWAYLPACVRALYLGCVLEEDCKLLWKGLPDTVSNVQLWKCVASVCVMHKMLLGIPKHVTSVTLYHWRLPSGAFASSAEVARLRSIAPLHVDLRTEERRGTPLPLLCMQSLLAGGPNSPQVRKASCVSGCRAERHMVLMVLRCASFWGKTCLCCMSSFAFPA